MLTNTQRLMTVHDVVDEVANAFLDFALYYQNTEHGVPLSTQIARHELPVNVLALAYADVMDFITKVRQLTKTNFEPSQLGVDFYFARNCCLTGFWDKPEIYGEYANVLQEIAEKYTPFYIENHE